MLEKLNKKIILDVETTGLDWKNNDIIQFSALAFSQEWQIIEKYNHYNKDIKYIPPFIQKLTQIKESKLAQLGINEYTLAREVAKIIDGCDVFAYNANFDRGFVEALMKKHSLFPKCNWICVLELANIHLDIKSKKLISVCEHFGYKSNVEFHNSEVDIEATLFVLKKLKEIEKIRNEYKYV